MKKLISITLCFILAITGCFAQTTVTVKKAGTLGTLLTQEQQDTCVSLIVCGKINSEDIRVLRRMAGYAEEGFSTGKLERLSLDDCKIQKCQTPYMILDAKEEYLAGTGLPAFIQNVRNAAHRFSKETVKQYTPIFYLNHVTGDPIVCSTRTYNYTTAGNSRLKESNEWSAVKHSVGNYQFAKGVSEEEWKEMKKMRINKWKGYEIVKDGDNYTLHAYTQKDKFPQCAFYKCPNLKILLLPRNAELDLTVRGEHSPIQFMQESEKK